MTTARIFQYRGSQAVGLPKGFQFEGDEVQIEKRGDEVVLTPIPIKKRKFASLNDVAAYMRENYPEGADFPGIEQPGPEYLRDIYLD